MQQELFKDTETMIVFDIHWNSDIITEDGFIDRNTGSFVDIFSFSVETLMGTHKVVCDTGCSSLKGELIFHSPHLHLYGPLASETGYRSIFFNYNLMENTAIFFDDVVAYAKSHFVKRI